MNNTPSANELGLSGFKDLLDKNFWTRPEGKFGKGILIALGVALVAGAIVSLPAILTYLLFVVSTMTNILWHASILFVSYMLLTNKTVITMAGIAYRLFIRSIAKTFVDMAPVAVTRDLIRKAYVRIETAGAAIRDFKVTMGQIKRTLTDMQDNIAKKEAGAKLYLRQKNFDGASLQQKGAERIRASYTKLNEFYKNMEFMCRIAEQMKAKTTLKIRATEENLELQITEFETSQKIRTAVKSLREAIQPNKVEQDMFDDGVAKMALEVTQAVVEFDDFITLGQTALADVDLDDATFNEKAMAQIQQWAKESGSSVLAPGEIQSLHDIAHDPNQAYDVNSPTPSVAEIRNSFNTNDFFSK